MPNQVQSESCRSYQPGSRLRDPEGFGRHNTDTLSQAWALHKSAIWQMSNDRLALAIASLKEATELWQTLSFFALMGGLQSACGLTTDARQTYQTCIHRADELTAVEPSDDSEQML